MIYYKIKDRKEVNTMANKQYYGMTLDPDVANEIKRMAVKERRSFSFYVNQILGQELQRQNKPKPIRRKEDG